MNHKSMCPCCLTLCLSVFARTLAMSLYLCTSITSFAFTCTRTLFFLSLVHIPLCLCVPGCLLRPLLSLRVPGCLLRPLLSLLLPRPIMQRKIHRHTRTLSFASSSLITSPIPILSDYMPAELSLVPPHTPMTHLADVKLKDVHLVRVFHAVVDSSVVGCHTQHACNGGGGLFRAKLHELQRFVYTETTKLYTNKASQLKNGTSEASDQLGMRKHHTTCWSSTASGQRLISKLFAVCQ